MTKVSENHEGNNVIAELDKRGFVFIDDKDMPYWVAIRYGKPMLAYWHEVQKSWVNLREVTLIEIGFMYQRRLEDELAMYYHKLHANFCGGMMF
jgi:hypothetical protein